VLLTLDSYNNGTDPDGPDGSMYYNTARRKFRCKEAGSWRNCISGSTTQILANDSDTVYFYSPTAQYTMLNDLAIYVPAGGTLQANYTINVAQLNNDAAYAPGFGFPAFTGSNGTVTGTANWSGSGSSQTLTNSKPDHDPARGSGGDLSCYDNSASPTGSRCVMKISVTYQNTSSSDVNWTFRLTTDQAYPQNTYGIKALQGSSVTYTVE
jgi:hypothetical protein